MTIANCLKQLNVDLNDYSGLECHEALITLVAAESITDGEFRKLKKLKYAPFNDVSSTKIRETPIIKSLKDKGLLYKNDTGNYFVATTRGRKVLQIYHGLKEK